MNIHDVALVAFGSLVQKDNTAGMSDRDRDALCTKAYQYAEAFLKAQDDWDSAHPKTARTVPLKI